MKPAFHASVLVPFVAAAAVAAHAGESGGFKGPDSARTATVAEAREMPDDADVRLVGTIVKSLGDEKYEFQDDTGTITVEVDDDEWGGVEATPATRVELTGDIDKDSRTVEVDVDAVRLAP